jgi:predicted DNA-binding transcriptional regulator AlpA
LSKKTASLSAIQNESNVDFDVYTRLLTKRDLAKIIGKSIRSVENLMRSKTVPYLKIGHSVRFRLREVEKALQKHTVKEVSL